MRDELVQSLIAEVLGPRGGVNETLADDPRGEYITGVLAPEAMVIMPDADAEAALPIEEADGEEDLDDRESVPPPLLSPALDPRALPRSMGVSFVVENPASDPEFEICLTWARYKKVDKQWTREPRSFVTGIKTTSFDNPIWINANGRCSPEEAEASLHIITSSATQLPTRVRITIQFVNRLRSASVVPVTEKHIFQPQIRVCLREGTTIVPAAEIIRGDSEEEDLQFLYRERTVLARGHLCSAIWKDIDPERISDGDRTPVDVPPWHWVDGQILPPQQRDRFSTPDIRTEFVPLYQVDSPSLEWDQSYGAAPELRANVLAEMWEPSHIQQYLHPLVAGYNQWIDQLESQAIVFTGQQERIAKDLLQRCRVPVERMQRGIDLLVNDIDARLSFCFANKTMDIQSCWSPRQQPLKWYPFQLAFILISLESIVRPESADRHVCDLIWVPTGAGKTEAYLAIAAFTMALRRLKEQQGQQVNRSGAGTSVISRYTLRLLTIQQFRRALGMITACELLRVSGLGTSRPVGWRPSSYPASDDMLWGFTRFSAGLWVGGGVTPNRLLDGWAGNSQISGAISILKGRAGTGEPAQVLNCPACNSLLAVPNMGLLSGNNTLHMVVSSLVPPDEIRRTLANSAELSEDPFNVVDVTVHPHSNPGYLTLSFALQTAREASAEDVNRWWQHVVHSLSGSFALVAIQASRPGYFIRNYVTRQGNARECDFDIFCPNPNCELNTTSLWIEGLPANRGLVCDIGIPAVDSSLTKKLRLLNAIYREVPRQFRSTSSQSGRYLATHIPIPAYTVDDQIYHRCPSLVVATVDKIARLSFEPKGSSLFGNIDHYHQVWGYYRQHKPPYTTRNSHDGHPTPIGLQSSRLYTPVEPLKPPELIIQDELHLVEGPLGSMVGIYETAIDELCREKGHIIKYIASTATVRRADQQIQSLFRRYLHSFPPPGLTSDERFFIAIPESHPLQEEQPSRLYVGICAPGKGPLTPIVRIWARLLQTTQEITNIAGSAADPFWTLTGYFNAIRELAGARALYRQDIIERLDKIAGNRARALPDEDAQELSSRTNATDLPSILNLLNATFPDAQDALFTTAMFGTGIDISRLALMVVHGQPKTTSAYIQATGRVGRKCGALVVTFLRATRPRDLNHYEFFSGYHRQLHRFVEPITVMPFSPGALDRAAGPVAVALLRNIRGTTVSWHVDSSANQMATSRSTAPEVQNVPSCLESRAQAQPVEQRPLPTTTDTFVASELDHWQQVAARVAGGLEYVDYDVTEPVVLGDPQHEHQGLDVVYENAPQSLRDVEETTGFQT